MKISIVLCTYKTAQNFLGKIKTFIRVVVTKKID